MTFMPGGASKKMSKVVVGDADSLIALAYKADPSHIKAQKISKFLIDQGYEIVYPNTAILEAITALKRGLDLPNEAHLLNRQYQAGAFTVEFVNEEIQQKASQRFEKTASKKNTIFDAVVAEVAVKLAAEYIFSFDEWYSKEGFGLIGAQKV